MPIGSAAAGAGCCACLPLSAAGGARLWAYWLLNKLLYRPRAYSGNWATAPECAEFTLGGVAYVIERLACILPAGSLYRWLAPWPAGIGPNPDGPTADLDRPLRRGESWQHNWLLRPSTQGTADTLWVIFGGNGMLATDWLPFCENLLECGAAKGAAFLLIDYPGYGANGGMPSPESVPAASYLALTEALKNIGGNPRVNLLGHSLGAAAASQLAVYLASKGISSGHLVLSAPFLSVPVMAEHILGLTRSGTALGKLPRPLFRLLQKALGASFSHRWDNSQAVPTAAAAGWTVNILHGRRDRLIPIQMGRELHRLAEKVASGNEGQHATFFEAPTAGHNDIMRVSFADYVVAMGFALPEASAALGAGCWRRRRRSDSDGRAPLDDEEDSRCARALTAAADSIIEEEPAEGLPPLPD